MYLHQLPWLGKAVATLGVDSNLISQQQELALATLNKHQTSQSKFSNGSDRCTSKLCLGT